MSNKESHIRQLLKRWISGDIKSKEEQQLDAAAQEDQFLKEAMAGLRSTTETDHQQKLTQLRTQLKLNPQQSRISLLTPLRMAAAILLLLTAGWFLWTGPGLNAPSDLAMSKESAPLTENESEGPLFEEPASNQTTVVPIEETAIHDNDTNQNITTQDKGPSSTTQTINNHLDQKKEKAPIAAAEPSSIQNYDLSEPSPPIVAEYEADDINEVSEETAKINASEDLAVTLPPAMTKARARADIEDPNNSELEEVVEDSEYISPIQATIPTTGFSQTTNTGIQVPIEGYRMIEGRIADSEGYPLIGVNILEEGTDNGTVSDIDGSFILPVRTGNDRQLNCSYIGFETIVIPITEKNHYDITLSESMIALDEVVITGLGINRRQDRDQSNSAEIAQSEYNQGQPTAIPTGGFGVLKDHIRQNTPYAVNRGKVRLRFTITIDGRPINFSVLRTTNSNLNQLAIDLISSGPNWVISNGQGPVQVEYLVRLR